MTEENKKPAKEIQVALPNNHNGTALSLNKTIAQMAEDYENAIRTITGLHQALKQKDAEIAKLKGENPPEEEPKETPAA